MEPIGTWNGTLLAFAFKESFSSAWGGHGLHARASEQTSLVRIWCVTLDEQAPPQGTCLRTSVPGAAVGRVASVLSRQGHAWVSVPHGVGLLLTFSVSGLHSSITSTPEPCSWAPSWCVA